MAPEEVYGCTLCGWRVWIVFFFPRAPWNAKKWKVNYIYGISGEQSVVVSQVWSFSVTDMQFNARPLLEKHDAGLGVRMREAENPEKRPKTLNGANDLTEPIVADCPSDTRRSPCLFVHDHRELKGRSGRKLRSINRGSDTRPRS
jgi:hypothetical protein